MRYPPHFTLAEFLASDTARASGIDNSPTWEAADNLLRLAATMERVRSLLGSNTVAISSGYRCYLLNEAVGGVPDSAHLDGLACDFTASGYGTPLDVCRAIEPYLVALEIDQLIHENSAWVHLGLSNGESRNECLTIDASGTRDGFG